MKRSERSYQRELKQLQNDVRILTDGYRAAEEYGRAQNRQITELLNQVAHLEKVLLDTKCQRNAFRDTAFAAFHALQLLALK